MNCFRIIDTAYKADADVTMAQIKKLGVRPSDVSLIVNTHTHCDHVGTNRIIHERTGFFPFISEELPGNGQIQSVIMVLINIGQGDAEFVNGRF